MELGRPQRVEDLLVVANTKHGPRAHANAEGDTGELHDHLREPRDAREFLAARMAVPDELPTRADLATLRTLRTAVEELADRRVSFPQKGIEPLLNKAAFQLDDQGNLYTVKAGWPGLASGLLLSLCDLSHSERPLKRCNNPACRWLFVDRSRNRTRQWCEMGMCGNRAKVARFKRRRQPIAAA
jgi:hypothetical protein